MPTTATIADFPVEPEPPFDDPDGAERPRDAPVEAGRLDARVLAARDELFDRLVLLGLLARLFALPFEVLALRAREPPRAALAFAPFEDVLPRLDDELLERCPPDEPCFEERVLAWAITSSFLSSFPYRSRSAYPPSGRR